MSADGDMVDVLTIARTMLADCYWFRRLKDPDNPWDQAAALAHIHFDALPPPANGAAEHSKAQLDALRPFALMWADINGGFRWQTDSATFCCAAPTGVIVIQLEIAVPQDLANDPTALAIDINRKFGRIIRTCDPIKPGLLDLAGPGYMQITDCHITGYIRTDRKAAVEIGDAVMAEIELKWGVG